MRIRAVELIEIQMPLREPFETSFGVTKLRPAILVKVEEQGGEEGWAEIVAGEGPWYSYETVYTAWHVAETYIIPHILGKELESPEAFYELPEIRRIRGHNMAKAGIEMALWDLEAKLRGIPLAKLLGGVRDRILSGVSIGVQPTPERLLKVIDRYLGLGYRRIKIKIKPGWDVEIVALIRKEYPDIPLQVDANAAYTLADAPHLKKLDDYGLLMIEQPLDYDDLVDHAELQRQLRTPICLDESIKSPADARRAHKLGSCRVINIKPGRVGGHRPSREIHDFCASVGMPVWIGGMLETGVGRGHLVALATLPNVRYPNDISASDRYYEEDIVEPPWTLNPDGTISVPNKPGIGVEVLEERIAKWCVRWQRFVSPAAAR